MAGLKDGLEQRGVEYMRTVYHTSPDWAAPLQVYPALMRLGDYSYYRSAGEQIVQVGVFSSQILPLKHTGMTYELLQETLKVLGDKRRMEILALLREHPRYGQELAEKLALTPATISHHMNMLLQVGLIALEQDGSRTQYSLEGETVERLLDALRRYLL